MNFYVLAGTRGQPALYALTLDNGAQASLGEMLTPLVEEVKAGDHVEFDAGYRPSEHEIVTLAPYELPAGMSVLMNSADAAALPALTPANLEEVGIRAIAAVEWNGIPPQFIAFQRVEARYVLRREPWRLMFAEGRFVRDDRPGLEIAQRVDAVFEDDTLYVVSWPKAHSILDLSMWIREATVSEMDEFFKHKKLSLAADFESEPLADTAVRRKIASITDSKVLDKCSVQSLRQYAAKFGVTLKISKGKIVLPSEKKEFKTVLGLLDEDLLSFEPTDERWVVNSKRRA
ncbi:MAG TPA: Kiwa anti-phage protein KwaB-like domain-containing protein [Vicinamibacterales bacterium]|jgi:hypothetical protein